MPARGDGQAGALRDEGGEGLWGARIWFSCGEAVFVDQSAEATATLDVV
jgi:hypothetical protein